MNTLVTPQQQLTAQQQAQQQAQVQRTMGMLTAGIRQLKKISSSCFCCRFKGVIVYMSGKFK
jgi:type II secretory pathway component PulJ